MKNTDISAPDYFHKVVDCQWACPAHTPVPEYIRLIAHGRYSDAYMINWRSNVFPGILGRTCDRPCEPACRRVRVEKEPVAICRLKRVAADYKDDIRDRLPKPAAQEKRQTHRAGRRRPGLPHRRPRSCPARLSLRRFRQRSESRRHDPHADPEIPPARPRHRRGMRLHPRSRRRIPRRQAHRQHEGAAGEDWDAIFVGSGAPRGRDLDIPGRQGSGQEHPYRHRLAVVGFLRPHQQDRQARCRARRRQYRDGLLPLRTPAGRRAGRRRGALRLRGNEGVPLGKGRRHARGHPDPQFPRAEGIHARERQA